MRLEWYRKNMYQDVISRTKTERKVKFPSFIFNGIIDRIHKISILLILDYLSRRKAN